MGFLLIVSTSWLNLFCLLISNLVYHLEGMIGTYFNVIRSFNLLCG